MNHKISPISLRLCSFDKHTRKLVLSSEFFAGRFPKQVYIQSHHTGKVMEFVMPQPGHKYHDQDCYDGEMCVYIPAAPLKNVECLTIIHEY